METLSQRVAKATEAALDKGYTAITLAKEIGVSKQTIYNWKDGRCFRLKGENLVELARVSGFSALWIMKNKGPKQPIPEAAIASQIVTQMEPGDRNTAIKILNSLIEPKASNGN